MAITTTVYGNTLAKMVNGDHPWDSATWKMQLMLDSMTPNKEHDFRDDVTASEAAGSTAQTLTATAAAASGGYVVLDVTDATVTFAAVTTSQTIGGVLIYASVGSAATDPILVLCDFVAGTIESDGVNNIVITPGANGLLRISY